MAYPMTGKEILDAAGRLADWLDAETYPQCRAACEWIVEREGDPENALCYAERLHFADGQQDLPAPVGELIIGLYHTAITMFNSAEAMLNLGALYYTGRGCEQDYGRAMQYYGMAAERGSVIALENLGYCYYYGRDVEVDYERAYYYYSQAAVCGRMTALYKIGDLYRYGLYLPQNGKRALELYRQALRGAEDAGERAYGPVCLRIGDCFLHGVGTDADARQALEYYQEAERALYDMVADGEDLYRGSLRRAIEGQEAARTLLRETLG